MTKLKIWDIILVIFSVYWTVFFLLDYWDKHPSHVIAFQYFRYTKLCTFLVVLGAGLSYLVTRFRTGLVSKFYNGAAVYILGIIIVTAITISYNKYLNLDIGTNNYLYMYGRLSINFFTGYFVILACYSAGNLILKKFYDDIIKHKHFTYDFGLGAIIITMLLFFIGVIGQLKMFVVLPMLLLFIGVNYKGSFDFVMDSFIRPFKIKKENGFWGYFCLFVLFAFLVLNHLSNDLPFPVGFDSRNLYMNIAKQIGESGELVHGYQPYSWSLFMSLGFILFAQVETSLFLSFVTGILCLFTTYHLSHNYFKLNHTLSLIAVLALGTLPTFANQFFAEHKTDFGLIFFQLISLCYLIEWITIPETNKANSNITSNFNKPLILILIGLFVGFGLSIKLLNLIFLFGLVIIFWNRKGNLIGVFGLCLLMFALVLIIGINNISGLGKYHLGNDIAKWVYLVLGLLFFSISFLKNIKEGFYFIKNTSIVAICSLLTFSPWIVKNYSETKSLSPMVLLQGGKIGPDKKVFMYYLENPKKE